MLKNYLQQYRKKGLTNPKARVKVWQDILFVKLIERMHLLHYSRN